MKNKVKSAVASAALVAGLVLGGGAVSVAAAEPAQASVDTNCRTVFANGVIYGYTFTRYYNIVERMWTWKASEQIYVYNRQACPWWL